MRGKIKIMTKIMLKCWDANKEKLENALKNHKDLRSLDYEELLKLIFEHIYNSCNSADEFSCLDLEKTHVIDDGGYQGTLIVLIPFNTYQPSEYDYIMSYVGYGSCCVCDPLQAAQDSNTVVDDLMYICKDIVSNTIKPYNHGWRNSDLWTPVEEKGGSER